MQISVKSVLISTLILASTMASGLTWAGAVVAPPVHLTYPKKMTAQFVWNQVLARQATYIQDGNKGPIIYDFQDPNCPYCHVLYKAEAPLIRAGLLTVRYVPVAFISPNSLPEAAAWAAGAATNTGFAAFREHHWAEFPEWRHERPAASLANRRYPGRSAREYETAGLARLSGYAGNHFPREIWSAGSYSWVCFRSSTQAAFAETRPLIGLTLK
ncbi:MAG: hypothetical protein ACYCY0_05605 [Acidithiobacillus ferrivorans]